MKNSHLILIATLVGVNVMIGCSPKHTASFGPSQKFYQPDKPDQKEVTTALVEDKQETFEDKEQEIGVEASKAEQNLVASARTEPTVNIHEKRAEEIIEKYKTKKELSDKNSITQLSWKEKKEVIKEVKRDIKELKKAKKKTAIENRKIYVGIIVALAGLLVAILVSGTIGGLGILVGIVLIAWGLIEDGSL